MQSDQNSFYSYVVLGRVNLALRDEANILKEIFGKQISLKFYYEDFIIFYLIEENA